MRIFLSIVGCSFQLLAAWCAFCGVFAGRAKFFLSASEYLLAALVFGVFGSLLVAFSFFLKAKTVR
jgi:hypothetical protein